MSQIEVWKDIPGFEGLYQASNLGKIKSLDRYTNYKNKSLALRKGKLLSPKVSNKGYLEVVLVVNSKTYYKRVHQLIATTFIPNPNRYETINHINEDKMDNRVENLEWCTPKHNIEAYTCSRNTLYQYDYQGALLKIWHSETRAADSVEGEKSGIQHCCRGTLKTYKGYIWTYCPITPADLTWRTTNNTLVKVEQLDLDGNIINTYNSTADAAKSVGCYPSAISMAINGLRKTIKGFIWRKKV